MVNSIGSYAALRGIHMTLRCAGSRHRGRAGRQQVHPPRAETARHRRLARAQTRGGFELTLYALDAGSAARSGGRWCRRRGSRWSSSGRYDLPRIAPFDADLYFVLRQTHSVLAYALVAVIAAHVSARAAAHAHAARRHAVADGVCARAQTASVRAVLYVRKRARLRPTRRPTLRFSARSPPPRWHSAIRGGTSTAPEHCRHGRTRRYRRRPLDSGALSRESSKSVRAHPKLVAVTPGGTTVLKRGNPFDGGLGNVDELLTAVVHGS